MEEELTIVTQSATDYENRMSFRDAVRLYKPAIFWSVLLSLAVIMEGYDTVLITSFFALDSFNGRYGDEITKSGARTISASWRSALANGPTVGEIIGLLITGFVQEWLGYKRTMGLAITCLAGFIFILFFAQDLPTLLVGEILCGLPWGAFQTVTTAYASEVAPVKLRAYLTTYVNMCWVIGQLIATGVLRGMANRSDQWSYRLPFAIQWIWTPIIFLAAVFAPESPWWLIRKRRGADARAALHRLTSAGQPDAFYDRTLTMMEHTTELEEQMTAGARYRDLFRGVDARRTEIACMTWLEQALCGTCFMGFSATLLKSYGTSSADAFNFQLGLFGMGVVGTLTSWFLMAAFGRRSLYIAGTAALSVLLLVIGGFGALRGDLNARWGLGSLIVIYGAIYDSTIGPVCYSLVSEMSSTRLKAKTIVVARICFQIASIIVNIIASYQFTDTAWNWGPYAGFFWAGTNTACLVWMWFRLPEPKDRTYGEIDILFENRVPARKFKSTDVQIHQYGRNSALASGVAGRAAKDGTSEDKKPRFRTVEFSRGSPEGSVNEQEAPELRTL